MIKRELEKEIHLAIRQFPAVGIVGSRQVGKTTLARTISASVDSEVVHLDLEKPSDLAKLTDPEAYLRAQQDKMVILDEVQRMPELFPLLRVLIDEKRTPGRFLILGSASPELLRQSSESLAGRIAYHELHPLLLPEVRTDGQAQKKLWLRGGFPLSFLASGQQASLTWRKNFLLTFTERDLPMLGFPPEPMVAYRFIQMLAGLQGQVWNAQLFAKGLDITHPTAVRYRDFLAHAYLLRILSPFSTNLRKRNVKSPKVYFRDAGLLHFLLNIKDEEDMWGHPVSGMSWEGFVIEQVLGLAEDYQACFFGTQHETEIDLILMQGGKPFITIEVKQTNAPKLSRSFKNIIDDLKAPHNFVVTPASERYPIRNNIEVISLAEMLALLPQL